MTMAVKEPPVKKKAAARHRRVARLYDRWLSENRKASRKRKVETFNSIADNEFNSDEASKS